MYIFYNFYLRPADSISPSVCHNFLHAIFFGKIEKTPNSVNFQARRPKFCMVVELDLLYLYIASFLTSASTSFLASEVNISNNHNSLIFQARRLKFCMVVDLNLLYIYPVSVLTSASASEVNILIAITHSFFKLGG